MTEVLNAFEIKIKKTWLKMLKAYAKGKMDKAKRLEQKVIKLELQLKDV